ncbi:unnamed protein product [Rhodiola kirilowii]
MLSTRRAVLMCNVRFRCTLRQRWHPSGNPPSLSHPRQLTHVQACALSGMSPAPPHTGLTRSSGPWQTPYLTLPSTHGVCPFNLKIRKRGQLKDAKKTT